MARALTRALAIAALVIVVPGCRTAAPGKAPSPEVTTAEQRAWRRVPLGLCEDYPASSRSPEVVERDMQLLDAAGVKVLRVSFGWDTLEPEKDRYDFAFWDDLVQRARAHGVRLIPYVAYTPRWAADGGTEADFWKRPPRDDAQFAELVSLLASRYRDSISSWELWNEPDNADFWTGSVERYARMLASGAAAVRAAVPKAKVVSGGLAGRLGFLQALFAEQQASPHVDVVNLHAYFETWNPDPLESIVAYVAGAAAIVRQHGAGQTIWMAEVGYSNHRVGGTVSPYVRATYRYEHTLDFQAVALVRTTTLLFSSPLVSLVAWYELKDPPGTDQVIGDENNRHLGVSFSDRRPKPALGALQFVRRTFEDGFIVLDAETVLQRNDGSASEVHAFLTPARHIIVVAWLKTRNGTGEPTAGTSGDTEDPRRETVRVLLRRPASSGHLVDLNGATGAAVNLASDQAGTSFTLGLTGGSVVIVDLLAP